MNTELQVTRRQNSNLDSDRHERDKTLNHLRTRVAVLEQELKDKELVNIFQVLYHQIITMCNYMQQNDPIASYMTMFRLVLLLHYI